MSSQSKRRRRKKNTRASRRGSHPASHKNTAAATPTISSSTVIFVHGIGRQQRGDTFKSQIEPTVTATRQEAENLGVTLLSDEARPAKCPTEQSLTLSKNNRTGTVHIKEFNWSHHRRNGLSEALWTIRMLPAVLLLLIGDSRDTLADATETAILGEKGKSLKRLARRVSRAWIGVCLTALMTAIFSTIMTLLIDFTPAAVIISILLTIATLTISLLASSYNIGAQVALAAQDTSVKDSLILEIRNYIQRGLSDSDRVIVVAHSQGAYLSYLATADLKPRERARTSLITLGSGLRPISLLAGAQSKTMTARAWIVALLLILASIPATFALDWGIFNLTLLLDRYRGALDLFLYAGGGTDWKQVADGSVKDLRISARPPSELIGLVIFSLIPGSIALRLSRKFFEKVTIPTLKPALHSWLDITTVHDIVGRLNTPPTPQADRHLISLGGSFVTDHTNYFSPWSLMPRVVGRSIIETTLGGTAAPWAAVFSEVNKAFLLRARNRRRILWIFVGTFGLFIAFSNSVFGNTSPGSSLAGLFAGTITLLIALPLARSEKRQQQRDLLSQTVPMEPKFRKVWIPHFIASMILGSLYLTELYGVLRGALQNHPDVRFGFLPIFESIFIVPTALSMAWFGLRGMFDFPIRKWLTTIAPILYVLSWVLDACIFHLGAIRGATPMLFVLGGTVIPLVATWNRKAVQPSDGE